MATKKATKKEISKALNEWEPHQIYHNGKGKYDMVIRFGKINKGFILSKSDGHVVAEIDKGYATVNSTKQPVWKLLGYSSKNTMSNAGISEIAKEFVKDTYKKGR